MKECKDCQFEKDAEPRIQNCDHVWHNDTVNDMCCKCGVDFEMMVK